MKRGGFKRDSEATARRRRRARERALDRHYSTSGSPPRRPRAVTKEAKRRKRQRRDREWLRAYGSIERVKAVKAMQCLVPGCTTRAVNAHTKNGGMGRKADAKWITRICKAHHTDGNDSMHWLGSAEAFNRHHNVDVFEGAAEIERLHPTALAA